MEEVIYRIESMFDKENNFIENERRMARRYSLQRVEKGSGAVLVNIDNPNEVVITSVVEDVYIFKNIIRIATKNTSYWLTPFVEEVNIES